MKHYLDQGLRVFFLPDEHLATNTAHDLGLPDIDVLRYDPTLPEGGLADAELGAARVVVWKGFCHVHTNFTVQHIRAVRESLPDAKIIVHPEAPKDVVRAADAHGSTAQIIRYVEDAPAGSTIVIGTERQLVMRLAEEQKGRVRILALLSSSCPNMARTTEAAVLDVLTTWPASTRVRVPEDVAAEARLCLERMLAL
jgi:quinolinate synthase